MSSKSSYYNGILALGATAVDNGTGGGWEKILGDHAVKLHGRTFHFLPQTGGCGGLEYFTFNAQEAAVNHAFSLNTNLCEYILQNIFHELKENRATSIATDSQRRSLARTDGVNQSTNISF
jgi:hypothetical protein